MREYERFRAFTSDYDYEHSLAITSGYEHSRAFTSNCERLRARYFPKVGIESGTVDVREADGVTGEGHVFLPEDEAEAGKAGNGERGLQLGYIIYLTIQGVPIA